MQLVNGAQTFDITCLFLLSAALAVASAPDLVIAIVRLASMYVTLQPHPFDLVFVIVALNLI